MTEIERIIQNGVIPESFLLPETRCVLYRRKTKKRILLFPTFYVGILGGLVSCNKGNESRKSWKPYNMEVKLDSTNLPIVSIVTSEDFDRDTYSKARLTIICNGDGKMNYCNIDEYPNQNIDYDGEILIRYRGHSSYIECPKKSFAIRPLNENGKKKKSSLLGMRKDKKWALRAVQKDRSLIHDVLTNELQRNYMDFVPKAKHCEVLIDGIYVGVYLLSEQITHNRLGISKAGADGDDLTGGYLFQVDRPLENRYISKYHSRKNNGEEIKNWNPAFYFEGISYDEMTDGQRNYICDRIDSMEKAIDDLDGYTDYIDALSFVDYQLATEFSHNGDGYRASVYLYKDVDAIDPHLKISIWDFDVSYGTAMGRELYRSDIWAYDVNDRILNTKLASQPKEMKCIPFWWKRLMDDKEYLSMMKKRWTEYRRGEYTQENIFNIIDSLEIMLTCNGAEYRNDQAWQTWTEPLLEYKGKNKSYQEEIAHLKSWIKERLTFMDKYLLIQE